MAGFSKLLY